jgi:hypothetical protein
MTDLRERFAETDRVEMPAGLWSEARQRAREPEGDAAWKPSPPRRRRLVAIAVAFALFAVSGVFAWQAFQRDGRLDTPTPEPSQIANPGVNPLAALPEGWTELPAPPDVRTGAASAWTGSHLIVWGGQMAHCCEESLEDGYALDPVSGRATALPPAPIGARSFSASAWTGSELLIWGGTSAGGRFDGGAILDDGAAYDPEAGNWRLLPPAPIEGRMPFSVWTGSELIVWGSQERDRRFMDGAAYDPAADTWRTIADAPFELTDGSAVWTGEEMIVFGAALHGGNFPESETAIGAAYNPGADTWRRLPDSDLSPQASTAAWDGGEMIAWDYLNGSQAYDSATDSWRRLARVPSREYECSPQSVAIAGYVVGDYCGQLLVYSAQEAAWHNIAAPHQLMFELVPAGLAVLVPASTLESGEPSLYAFRPPASFGCAGLSNADPDDPETARAIAEAFAEFRVDRAELDLSGVMTAEGAAAYAGESSGLSPLLADYIDGEVVFVDGPLGGGEGSSYEVGVRLIEGDEDRVEETIFVTGPASTLSGDSCPLAVVGARPGLLGP